MVIAGAEGNLGSAVAKKFLSSSANQVACSAAKSAVIRLTEGLASELKNDGGNTNNVLPGTIDTPQNRENMPNADYSCWVSPEAITDVVLLLASDASRAITGASIPVYGRS